MRMIFLINVLIFHVGLLYSQSSLDEYCQFTTERRQVLSKMGEFFDETIRKNFPDEADTLSYLKFSKCIALAGSFSNVILNVDRERLKEINQMLFKAPNYYFFYSRYIYMGKPSSGYTETIVEDSVPTRRHFGTRSHNETFGVGPILNFDGYIKVVPEDNPAIRVAKEDIVLAGDFSPTIFISNVMGINVREISHPIVKELCAVLFWRYICSCACIDLLGRKSFCELNE